MFSEFAVCLCQCLTLSAAVSSSSLSSWQLAEPAAPNSASSPRCRSCPRSPGNSAFKNSRNKEAENGLKTAPAMTGYTHTTVRLTGESGFASLACVYPASFVPGTSLLTD